ncbi:peroxiredoxin family protein [Maribacter forsetii]|uniref:peroxiredoxin family protein n=1 Tax=Maribacter forsetii TaxID=444515 RepID=UPI00068F5D9A|nr:redoxin domain-containing protein [Maribacter forsetii]
MSFKILVIVCIAFICFSCKEEKKVYTPIESTSIEVNMTLNEAPEDFRVQTINGNIFDSADHKGGYLVLFIYDKSYLKSSETYDMVAELNETYSRFKGKVTFVGVIEGLIESEEELRGMLAKCDIHFNQIDNTKNWSMQKQEKLDLNIFCTPAKIIIDPEGKVIFSSCGGKTESLNNELAYLVKDL